VTGIARACASARDDCAVTPDVNAEAAEEDEELRDDSIELARALGAIFCGWAGGACAQHKKH
jgi:hypothetical protein